MCRNEQESERAGPWGDRTDLPNPSPSKRAGSSGRTDYPLPRHAGYPAQKQYRSMRRGRRDRQDLRLPDRLHFTEEVCPTWACRFPAGGGLHLQRCSAGRYHRGIHPVFIPDFSGEPHYSKPIRAMVRKGKERFVCDARLAGRLEAVREKKKNAEQMKALLSLRSYYDLDAVTGLSGFDRRQVCVPKVCEKSCPLRNACRYHQYLKEARSAEIFVQICNHNYLLADAAHRLQEMRPLLNDYRALVIDEAHKLPDAARQMYGQSLSAEDFRELCDLLAKEKYILASQRLREKFRALMGAMCRGELLEEAQRTAFILTPDREAALRDCLSLLRQLQNSLPRTSTVASLPAGNNRAGLGLFYRGPKIHPLHPVRQGRKPQPLRRQPGTAGAAAPGAVAERHPPPS